MESKSVLNWPLKLGYLIYNHSNIFRLGTEIVSHLLLKFSKFNHPQNIKILSIWSNFFTSFVRRTTAMFLSASVRPGSPVRLEPSREHTWTLSKDVGMDKQRTQIYPSTNKLLQIICTNIPTYYIHTIYILYTYYIHTIYILYTSIYILYTYYIHTIYILYTYYIHTIYILYTYYIHTIYILYTYYIHTIYILYTYYIHTIYHDFRCVFAANERPINLEKRVFQSDSFMIRLQERRTLFR